MTLLVVGTALSNHPNDQQEAEPAVEAISARVGKPKAAAFDNGFWSPAQFKALEV